ncbi:MAG TPA: carbamoyltransferase N-terminal domain-containing protein, partial [Bacteroidia bacterium]|nr:carbamoyltransferase N-terminal domain-containing protein [Bacteroidia bacterium]
FSHFRSAIPLWVKKRLWISSEIKKKLNFQGEILFANHHDSHAAAAFYTSGFEDAAIITLDGVGEFATTTIGRGMGNKIDILREQHF